MQPRQLTRKIYSMDKWRFFPLDKAKVSGGGTLKVENGILKTKGTSTGDIAYVWLPTILHPYGTVEVKFEAKKYSGGSDPNQAGGVGYKLFSTQPDINQIQTTLDEWTKIDMTTTDWKFYTLSVQADPAKPYLMLYFGSFTNSVGEFWFRSVEVNYYNYNMVNPDVRFCKIVGNGGTNWYIDQNPNGFSCFGCYDLVVDSSKIRVYYDWVHGWGIPIIQANIGTTGSKTGWSVQHGEVTRNYADLYLIDKTGNAVSPTGTSQPTSIHFMAMTF